MRRKERGGERIYCESDGKIYPLPAHGDNTLLLSTRVVIPCGDQVGRSDDIAGFSASYLG